MIYFSIIIPTYNSAQTVQKCLESVLYQTLKNIEILIVDGVSTDNTLKLIREYNDTRIKILSEPDNGIYDAMNKGIKLANGEWLYFLGSDDSLYDENVLEDVKTELNKQNVDVIYGNVLMKPSNRIYDGEFTYEKMQTTTLCHQAIFYKKKIFDDFGLYNIRYKVLADHDMNLNWLFSNKHNNLFIERTIAQYSEFGFSSLIIDEEFEKDFNEKFFRLTLSKYSFLKLKELSLQIAIIKKQNNEKFVSIKYYLFYYVFRFLDLIKRKLF